MSSFLYVQWNYKTNEPCPYDCLSVCLSVRLSVSRHLGALLCTDECSVILRWILFSFGTWKEHIFELCICVLFLKNHKKMNFGKFSKNYDIWTSEKNVVRFRKTLWKKTLLEKRFEKSLCLSFTVLVLIFLTTWYDYIMTRNDYWYDAQWLYVLMPPTITPVIFNQSIINVISKNRIRGIQIVGNIKIIKVSVLEM